MNMMKVSYTGLVFLALLGCSVFANSWQEEVLLISGELIIVKRTAQGSPLGELGGPGGWEAKEMSLEIEKPDRVNKPPEWRFAFVPMLFDYDAKNEEWFVVATFYTCGPWYDLGRPDLPYVEYRARQGAWEIVPLSPELIGRKANLLTGVSSKGEPPLVTLEEKKKRDGRAGASYRTILGKWHTTC